MIGRDYMDIAAGLFLVALGLGAALHALSSYDLGTLRMMGPGMVPTAVGFAIAGFGVLIAVPAAFRRGTLPPVPVRTLASVSLAVAAFALAVPVLGIGPAVFLVALISSFADREASLGWSLVLPAGLALAGFALFRYALGVPMQFLRVPL